MPLQPSAAQWAAFGATQRGPGAPMNPALAAAVAASQPSPPPAKPLPVRDATEADKQLVAKGLALQLQETWRGHFVGDKLSKAGAAPCCMLLLPLPLAP